MKTELKNIIKKHSRSLKARTLYYYTVSDGEGEFSSNKVEIIPTKQTTSKKGKMHSSIKKVFIPSTPQSISTKGKLDGSSGEDLSANAALRIAEKINSTSNQGEL